MKKKLFQELEKAVIEGGKYLQGKVKPSRSFKFTVNHTESEIPETENENIEKSERKSNVIEGKSKSWNYRILHTHGSQPEEWNCYAIHEVYYEENTPVSFTEHSVSPVGDDIEDFLRSWERYKTAFEKPILIFDYDAKKFTDEEILNK